MKNRIYVSTYPSLRVTIVATHHTGMFYLLKAFSVCELEEIFLEIHTQPRSQGLLAFQYGGGSWREDTCVTRKHCEQGIESQLKSLNTIKYMKIDNSLLYQIKWKNIQTEQGTFYNFHVITTKVSQNCNKIVFLVLVFRKTLVFTEFSQNVCR